MDPSYFPNWASELALALPKKAFCPASIFSFFPYHALIALFWSALPNEKLKVHGLLISVILFIWFRWIDAYYSVCPPDKNVIPQRAAGTVLERARTVRIASYKQLFSFFWGCSDP